MMASAVIVIPVVQSTLKDFEYRSLKRCLSVLGKWPIRIVAPESLDLSDILALCGESVGVVRFKDDYFRSIADYNRLMISREFYNAFPDYEYLLLYQLDAYVFEDRLAEWCAKGYDYLGAPAFHAEGYEALTMDEADTYASALSNSRLVFNGGLSLRRIKAMKRLISIYNTFFSAWKGNEDMLFSLASTRLIPLKPFIKLPDWRTALEFSFEKSPAASYAITGQKLPFACHAWQRYDPKFWGAFIS